MTKKPLVAIVGRPNVGKSTLFNRLIGMRLAIVEDEPGVTRDRIHASCDWNGREFTLIDTGGLEPTLQEELYDRVEEQARQAILEADVIMFLLDGKEGLTPGDYEIAELLRRSNKPVILVVNKLDNLQQESKALEFYALGLGDPFPVSALNGINTGDLLDEIVALLPPEEHLPENPNQVRIAIMGRPNVGKSSLVNRILGSDRLVTSDIPGTTRDAVDVVFPFQGYELVFIDTAGMRRVARIKEKVEYYSNLRAHRAIDRSDICILILDATEGVSEMDQRIAGYAHEAGRGLIIAVNKWDLIKFDSSQFRYYQEEIKRRLAFCDYAPIVFISALTGRNVDRLLQLILEVRESQTHVIAQEDLNLILRDLVTVAPLPQLKGQSTRLIRLNQINTSPPRFRLTISNPQAIHFSYLRQIENRIRNLYPYMGTAVKVFAGQQNR
ncbi:MAG: ribosome biogenesis GTPase Der [Firmicutes bacterium]|jgi:GTP-binding protein|nr:ribosome biogenesis GTPase Der [Bacillota bacterium]